MAYGLYRYVAEWAVHEDLYRRATRHGMAMVVVAAAISAVGPSILLAIAFGLAVFPIGMALVTPALIVLLCRPRASAVRAAHPNLPLLPPDGRIVEIVEGLQIASGTTGATVSMVEHESLNLAVFPEDSGVVVCVTTQLAQNLTRDHIEALCEAQLAIVHDNSVSRLLRATSTLAAWRIMSPLILLGWVHVAFFSLLGFAIFAAWMVGERVRWWSNLAADATCVRFTRHPEALASALVELAKHSGPRTPVKAKLAYFGSADDFWALPVSNNFAWITSSHDRVTHHTSEMVKDIRLLTRAAAVRQGTAAGITLASWKEIARRIKLAGTAAAKGQTFLVEGLEVGVLGVSPPGQSTGSTGKAAIQGPPEDSNKWSYCQAITEATAVRPRGEMRTSPAAISRYAAFLAVVVDKSPHSDRSFWNAVLSLTRLSVTQSDSSPLAVIGALKELRHMGSVRKRVQQQCGVDFVRD